MYLWQKQGAGAGIRVFGGPASEVALKISEQSFNESTYLSEKRAGFRTERATARREKRAPGGTTPTHTINCRLKKVFADSELEEGSVIRKFRITAADGKRRCCKGTVRGRFHEGARRPLHPTCDLGVDLFGEGTRGIPADRAFLFVRPGRRGA